MGRLRAVLTGYLLFAQRRCHANRGGIQGLGEGRARTPAAAAQQGVYSCTPIQRRPSRPGLRQGRLLWVYDWPSCSRRYSPRFRVARLSSAIRSRRKMMASTSAYTTITARAIVKTAYQRPPIESGQCRSRPVRPGTPGRLPPRGAWRKSRTGRPGGTGETPVAERLADDRRAPFPYRPEARCARVLTCLAAWRASAGLAKPPAE